MTYFADVGALARKDLLLELRARDTLPAMALFVVSTLVVFHFALPAGADEVAAHGLLAPGLRPVEGRDEADAHAGAGHSSAT